MGSLRETPLWADDIYRIQVTDPILGGEDGVINVQPNQLANRTAFLRRLLELEHGEDGSHAVTDAQIADAAALSETKLVLDVPCADILSGLSGLSAYVAGLGTDLDNVIGADGSLIRDYARSVLLGWKYGAFGFDFELFTGKLTMRDVDNKVVHGAIAGDDSLDCDATTDIVPGMRLLLTDGEHKEEVEVSEVLEHGRLRLTRDLQHTYTAPATLGCTDWQVEDGKATAFKGGRYYSKVTTVLEHAPNGRLVVRRDGGNGGIRVFHRDGRFSGPWAPAELVLVRAVDGGFFDEYYLVDGGYTQVRVEAPESTVVVRHMALYASPSREIVNAVELPRVTSPAPNEKVFRDQLSLDASTYRNAYRDPFSGTEYAVTRKDTGQTVLTLNAPNENPLDNLDETTLPPDGLYAVCCRHKSDIGEYSSWSEPVDFFLIPVEMFFGFLGAPKSGGFNDKRLTSLSVGKYRFGFLGAPNSAGFGAAMFTTEWPA